MLAPIQEAGSRRLGFLPSVPALEKNNETDTAVVSGD